MTKNDGAKRMLRSLAPSRARRSRRPPFRRGFVSTSGAISYVDQEGQETPLSAWNWHHILSLLADDSFVVTVIREQHADQLASLVALPPAPGEGEELSIVEIMYFTAERLQQHLADVSEEGSEAREVAEGIRLGLEDTNDPQTYWPLVVPRHLRNPQLDNWQLSGLDRHAASVLLMLIVEQRPEKLVARTG